MRKKLMRVSEFAERIGYSATTVRRWEAEGKITPRRTAHNQRYFTEEDVAEFMRLPAEEKYAVIVYTRVSSRGQKDDLASQMAAMETFCLGRGLAVDEWVSEIGSGMSFDRPKLLSILYRAMDGEKITLVVAHRDRLARFGSEVISSVLSRRGGEVIIANQESLSPHAELVQDILAIMHSFSSRLYGLRRYEKAVATASREGEL